MRLVGADGQQIGIVSREEALRSAQESNLDLVLISEHSDPPVAKIMNFGKHLYDKKKSESIQKKKQRHVHLKEIKFRPGIDIGDFNVKVKKLIEFLEAGDKAKVTMRFKGRELAHKEIGFSVMEKIQSELEEHGVLETAPKMEGKQAMMIYAPSKK